MTGRQSKHGRARRAHEIQGQIRQVLLEDLDLFGFPVPEDEYDRLIGGIYHLLVRKASQEEIVQWLEEMSGGHFGVPAESEACRLTAIKLLKLNVELP